MPIMLEGPSWTKFVYQIVQVGQKRNGLIWKEMSVIVGLQPRGPRYFFFFYK
jgi:hypothetical protein